MSLKADIEDILESVVTSSLYGMYRDRIQTRFTNSFFAGILSSFEKDYDRYYPGKMLEPDLIFGNLPLAGILLHRTSRAFFLYGDEKQALYFSNLVRLTSQMEIFYTADIGPGLKINHGLGLVIGAGCTIGKNALLYQNIVIGDSTPLSANRKKRPAIGDNLVMFSNAKILGPVRIRDNVTIQQNAVCTRDVDSNHIFTANGEIRPLYQRR